MTHRDHRPLLAALAAEYERRSPRSAALQARALRRLVDGGSHTLRLLRPFPPRIAASRGAYVTDEDGHALLDFWQGHHANILGHNPEVVTRALADGFASGFGLQSGFTDALQVEVAEILCDRIGAERVRFTTSGGTATMFATMLARAFTGRTEVLKVGGGWHGAQPWGLVGVDYHEDRPEGFGQAESRGLPGTVAEQTLVTRFNDVASLAQVFEAHGKSIACFIVEPFMGSAGCLPATRAFLEAARALATGHGALLIFDEVIAGFRFGASSAGRIYGVAPDLGTYAKIVGGGMPVAAVAGRAEVMALAGRGGGVKFSGGTYSCHPGSMLASRAMLTHLAAHEAEIYPRIAAMGAKARRAASDAFAAAGIRAVATGDGGDALPGSSMGAVHFPLSAAVACACPEETRNPSACDVELSDVVLQLALLCEDVFVMHGLGSVCAAHTDADIDRFHAALEKAARRIAPTLRP